MLRHQSAWKAEAIEKLRVEIRQEIDGFLQKHPPQDKIAFLLSQLASTKGDGEPLIQMKRYLYAMFALSEHCRTGGLSSAWQKRLIKLCEQILEEQKIPKQESRFAYLHGDLYLVQSEVHRIQGLHMQALWKKQVSNQLSQRANVDRASYHTLTNGIQLVRLGLVSQGIKELEAIDATKEDPAFQMRWALEYHVALRLSYQLDEASAFRKRHAPLFSDAEEKIKNEWDWEGLCLESQRTGEIKELMHAILPNHQFHQTHYGLECFFLAYAIREREWMGKCRFSNFKKSTNKHLTGYEVMWNAAKIIKGVYADEAEYIERLLAMGNVSSQLNELPSLYHELLVRAAIVRWLVRRPTQILSVAFIAEYQNLCSKISNARTIDVLNILGGIGKEELSITHEAA